MEREPEGPSEPGRRLTRRQLLLYGTAVAAVVVGGAALPGGVWRELLREAAPDGADPLCRCAAVPPALPSPTATGGAVLAAAPPAEAHVTPLDHMFVYYALGLPPEPLAPGRGELVVDGLVRHSLRLTYADLARLPQSRQVFTLECYVNTAGGELIGNLAWEGVAFRQLVRLAGVEPTATAVRVETADGHAPFVLPLAEVYRPETLLVSKADGVPLSRERGGPYTRLLIPGAGGNHTPKWITRISFVTGAAAAHPAPVNAGFLDPTPPAGGVVSRPRVALTGYAFAGPDRVATVELSTDNGATYQAVPFAAQASPYVWVYWRVAWQPPQAGYYVLRVRASGTGGVRQQVPGSLFLEVR